MKRIFAFVLSLMMVFTSMGTVAFAAGGATNVSFTVDKTTAAVGDTISVTLSNGAMTIESFTCGFTFDKEKLECTSISGPDSSKPHIFKIYDKDGEYTKATATSSTEDSNKAGTVGIAFAGTADVQYKEGVLLTATFRVKADGDAAFTLYEDTGGTDRFKSDSIATKTVKISKAPITSVSATVNQPVKGHPLDTSVNVYGATTYTAEVMWKDAEENMTATGDAKPGKIYTALITLTAKEGEAFASSLNNTTTPGGYTIEWLNSTELLLSKRFDRTNVKEATGIAIDNTTLTVAVPKAEPNMEQKAELPLTAKVNYDDGTDETVDATWSFVDPKPEGVDIEEGGKLTVTNKAADGTVKVKAAYNGMTTTATVTITKETLKPSAIVATAPTTGTNITIPNGGKNTSDNCGYTVYDQYGAEMTGIGVTWKMEPATFTGVSLTSTGGISVENNATKGTVKLHAESGGVKSNEITFNIARAASVPTLLTIEGSADSVNVPTVTKLGTTECAYAAYDAIVKDQYGEAMTGQTIEWSFTAKPGVTFNNGQLTVTNTADAGTVTITAKSGTFNATKTVTINKAAPKETFVRITAQDNEPPVTTIICTGSQRSEDYTATVYDQYGVEKQDDVNWSLAPAAYSGVSYEISETNGNIVTLKVAPNTAAGSFKLVATSQTVTTVKGELEIKVQKKNDVSGKINFNGGSLTYNGEGQEYEAAELDNSVTAGTGGAWTYTYAVKSGATGMLDAATGLPKIVGTYTVTATYEDSSNIGSKSATLNITPKMVDIPAPDTTVYTYDGTAKIYKISASADYTVNNATQTNANEAGYLVTVALKDEINTIWADGNTLVKHYTFKIMKATPTGEPAYTKITAAGKTLAEAALAIGTITPSGTIKWVEDDGTTVLPDTTPVAKNKPYKWLFTPADTINYNTLTGSLTPYYVASSGGSHVSKVQKPEITIIGSGKADLSADGRTATITAAAGHELVSVVLNGKEMGKVEKLTGLKTGDKATITFQAKTDGKAEMDKMIAQKASKLTLMARSKKTAKLNIKVVVKGDLKAITDAGYTVKYKFYRSTKKSAGYKAVLTKKAPTYYNTYGKKGTMYYYKARVMIYDKDGNFVAQTALKQCKYANRLWTK